MNYPELAFSEEARQLQTRFGSRSQYARNEQFRFVDGLTDAEAAFIAERDHFFLATVGPNGYPYTQHRGGWAGFVQVLDKDTLALLNFAGNQQFISVGNLMTTPKSSLFFIDYATRTRLKLYADITLIELDERPDLVALLTRPGYAARPQQIMLATVQAYDWNCSQHITPRFTAAELTDVLAAQQARIRELEMELSRVRPGSQAL